MQKLLVILPMFATACGGGFEPTSGDYQLDMVIMDDGCAFEDGTTDTGAEMEENITSIVVSEDGTMVTLDDVSECALDGVAFSCYESSVTFDASTMDETMEAVFSSTMETTAEWIAADMIEGEVSFGLSCEGVDCESVATSMSIPADCTSVWAVTLTMVEDTGTATME